VNEKLINGGIKEDTPEILIYAIPTTSGGKLRFVTSHGKYLGSVEFDCVDTAALLIMGNQFQAYAAQHGGGIQIAPSTAGLRTS
jgi:hypothetical protein